MKKILTAMMLTATMAANSQTAGFRYTDEAFADIQMLRYKVESFEKLTLRQKALVYYLSEAALQGRDILFDQNGRYNLRIRRMLETVYTQYRGDRNSKDFRELTTYLKRVWFASGIHHHYGSEKFQPGFSEKWLRQTLADLNYSLDEEIFPVIFNPEVMPMRVNQKDGDDLILTSAENYYGPGVTQAEAEEFYTQRKAVNDPHPIMMGLNSRLVKEDGELTEQVWREHGLYGSAITRIIDCLQKARPFCDTEKQQHVIDKLIEFYRTGDLRTYDAWSILWLKDTEDLVDFTNNFKIGRAHV